MLLATDADVALTFQEGKPQQIAITRRELEVLKLIAQELSGTQIAEKLFISPTTVETHRKNLMQKLNTRTTIGLVKYALKFQLV